MEIKSSVLELFCPYCNSEDFIKRGARMKKSRQNANFNQREKIAAADEYLGIFGVMEEDEAKKNQQDYAHNNVESKIVHNNLFLLSRGDQND